MAIQEKAITQLKKLLDSYDVSYQRGDSGGLWGVAAGEFGAWTWAAHDSGDDCFLVLIAYSPVKVPEPRVAQAAEYLHRVNQGVRFGCFYVDWETRGVGFRTSIPLRRGCASKAAVKELYFGNCSQMEFYMPGLFAVALGNVEPKRAIEVTEVGVPSDLYNEVNSAGSVDHLAGDPPINGDRRLGGRFLNEN